MATACGFKIPFEVRMETNEIRKKFIQFFQSKQHTFVPSASTIPIGDQTILFTIAGMTQFKACLTGEEVREYKRATNAQKCIRVGDLDDVGKDGRHLTMFEMLGSWSFGDYYKRDAIHWAYEFVRDELKLDLSKFWATVHTSDDEAYQIWKSVGVPEDRIVHLGDKDNFWAMGPTGPCGPCSELYLDQGESVGRCQEKNFPCKKGPGCDCDRYLEFWNLVFMQFNRQEDGTLKDLPMKSVDTGSGLERVAALVQGKTTAFDIDGFVNIKRHILKIALINKEIHQISPEENQCLNVISDHIRMLTFTLADGAYFSNEGRGYVLRRVLRRAVRYVHKLVPSISKSSTFLDKIVISVVKELGEFYPEILKNQKKIEEAIAQEELKFNTTLESGLAKFNLFVEEAKKNNSKIISGADVFILHDSFGFPSDLTRILCEEIGFTADLENFGIHMQEQRERSRAEAQFYKSDLDTSPWLEFNLPNQGALKRFDGYDLKNIVTKNGIEFAKVEIKPAHVCKIRQLKNKCFELVLANTPFYPEGGGQVADKGFFVTSGEGKINEFELLDVRKTPAQIVHLLRHEIFSSKDSEYLSDLAIKNLFNQNESYEFTAYVNLTTRKATARNHTATHLVHAALRKVLGDNVSQKGSLVNAHSLRFDFSHNKAMTKNEIEQVEFLVNNEILKNSPVLTHENTPIEKAKSMGAMAMFDEKYDDFVRVLEVSNFSLELCGGTHVSATGDIGLFKIISEGSVTSGVRRIEAITGLNSLDYIRRIKERISETAENLKCAENDVLSKILLLKENLKVSENTIEQLQSKLANYKVDELLKSAQVIGNNVKVVSIIIENSNLKELEMLCDKLKEKGAGICLLSCVADGKAQVVCSISKELLQINKNLLAGNVIKYICELIDGKGGGRPDFAKGGGNATNNLEAALEKTVTVFLKGIL